jgi:hypothetical protein
MPKELTSTDSIAQSDCRPCATVKESLGDRKFKADREVQTAVTRWLTAQGTD